jgi:hypothetical protein
MSAVSDLLVAATTTGSLPGVIATIEATAAGLLPAPDTPTAIGSFPAVTATGDLLPALGSAIAIGSPLVVFATVIVSRRRPPPAGAAAVGVAAVGGGAARRSAFRSAVVGVDGITVGVVVGDGVRPSASASAVVGEVGDQAFTRLHPALSAWVSAEAAAAILAGAGDKSSQ